MAFWRGLNFRGRNALPVAKERCVYRERVSEVSTAKVGGLKQKRET